MAVLGGSWAHFFVDTFFEMRTGVMELEDILQEIAGESHLILVDHTVGGTDASPKLKVVVDTEQGVTVGELTDMTRKLKRSPEMNSRYPRGFQLEVTSPGLDYPLTRDYQSGVM